MRARLVLPLMILSFPATAGASRPAPRVEGAVLASPFAFHAEHLGAVVEGETFTVRCDEVRFQPRCAVELRTRVVNSGAAALELALDARTLRVWNLVVEVNAVDEAPSAGPLPAHSRDRYDWAGDLLLRFTQPLKVKVSIPAGEAREIVIRGEARPGSIDAGNVIGAFQARHPWVSTGRPGGRHELQFMPSAVANRAPSYGLELVRDIPEGWVKDDHWTGEQERWTATLRVPMTRPVLGGAYAGYGPSEVNDEGEEIRVRAGVEAAFPRWAVYSLSIDGGDGGAPVVAPAVEAASPSFFPFVMCPSVAAGFGVPVRLEARPRAGMRFLFGYQWPGLGIVTSLDWYPDDPENSRVTTITRLSF